MKAKGFLYHLIVLSSAWLIATGPVWAQNADNQVTLDRSLFFADTAGAIVEVSAGTYLITGGAEDALELTGEGQTFTVRAEPYEGDAAVDTQRAVLVPIDDNEAVIALVDSDSAGRMAVGSYSGITTRNSTRPGIDRYRARISTVLQRPQSYSKTVESITNQALVRPDDPVRMLPAPKACSDVVLDKFHASADSNYPNNRLAMFTYAGLFSYPRMGSPAEVVVRIPDGVTRWSRVQFTFRTKLAGTADWQESLSILRPFSPALTQLTMAQANALGYLRSPGRPCFVKASLRHPRLNRMFMIGAGSWDDNHTGLELTFVDNEAVTRMISNETIPWSGGAVSSALLGFASNLPKAYDIELWYFNDAGAFVRYAAFPIRIANCNGPPPKRPAGNFALTCNG